ncbi:MAG: histidine phosphatase family protein [Hydrogenophilaceae bacterium]|nr:histidine phosphatase family protein [Hydrogenophilaceae bacterium]
MLHRLPIRLLALAACALGLVTAALAAEQPAKLPTLTVQQFKALLPKLQQGGYVFYFRHAASDMFQLDDNPVMGDCSTQRPLSEEGQNQARSIGNAFRRNKIPVGMIKTSPFCRAIDTAKLAFNRAEPDEGLYFATRLTAQERIDKANHLKRLLARRPADGSNSVIIAHNANIMEAQGIWPDEEGDAFLYKPDGSQAGAPLARIPVELWQQLNR